MLDIYTLGDDVLREETKTIKSGEFDSSLKLLVEAMKETLLEAEGVGLAAPQVGVSKRLFIVQLPNQKAEVYINPEIIEYGREEGPYEEGCLSIPGYYAEVIRPLTLVIKAQDENGKTFIKKADGLRARVIQHENDHLYGKLYIDHIPEDKQKKIAHSWEKRKAKEEKKKKK